MANRAFTSTYDDLALELNATVEGHDVVDVAEPSTELNVGDILVRSGCRVKATMSLPARAASFVPVPTALHPLVRGRLAVLCPRGLYTHQAIAIERGLNGDDVCVSTSTGSGKSLVFQALVAHRLLTERPATARPRALVLYPTKALRRDQHQKWSTFLDRLGLSVEAIDGDVVIADRERLLGNADVVLATPDIIHAWMLRTICDTGSSGARAIRTWLKDTSILVLDEAHSYDGAFGSHVAHLLRRIDAVLPRSVPMVVSTATLSEPVTSLQALTGRTFTVIGADHDSSPAPIRCVRQAEVVGELDQRAGAVAAAATEWAHRNGSRVLVFANTRAMVPRIHSALRRLLPPELAGTTTMLKGGYEVEDAQSVEERLRTGALTTVVTTSVLEVGVDIRGVDLVILVDWPPSRRAFWQRAGRAGRSPEHAADVVVLESSSAPRRRTLRSYVRDAVERTRIYLRNERIQAVHALCAGRELNALGPDAYRRSQIASLPASFAEMVGEAIDGSRIPRASLTDVRRGATDGPHRLPLRGADEQSCMVQDGEKKLGRLNRFQRTCEAYPGAIYPYGGRTYQIQRVGSTQEVVRASRFNTKARTEPCKVVKAVNAGEPTRVMTLSSGWVVETALSASIGVVGFRRIDGPAINTHTYGPESDHAKATQWYRIDTTGVAWTAPDSSLVNESVQAAIRAAAADVCELDLMDIRTSSYTYRKPGLNSEPVRGACIYDIVPGSLQLTSLVADRFAEIVAYARDTAPEDSELQSSLAQLHDLVAPGTWRAGGFTGPKTAIANMVFAPGSKALHKRVSGEYEEITVKRHHYGSDGRLLYELPVVGSTRSVEGASVFPHPDGSVVVPVDDDGICVG